MHLLAALLGQSGGASRPLLQQAGADLATLSSSLEEAISALPQVSGADGDVHVSADLGRVLNVADKLSQQGGDAYISSELVLLAMLEANNPAAKLLTSSGVSPEGLKSAIESVRGGEICGQS